MGEVGCGDIVAGVHGGAALEEVGLGLGDDVVEVDLYDLVGADMDIGGAVFVELDGGELCGEDHLSEGVDHAPLAWEFLTGAVVPDESGDGAEPGHDDEAATATESPFEAYLMGFYPTLGIYLMVHPRVVELEFCCDDFVEQPVGIGCHGWGEGLFLLSYYI